MGKALVACTVQECSQVEEGAYPASLGQDNRTVDKHTCNLLLPEQQDLQNIRLEEG